MRTASEDHRGNAVHDMHYGVAEQGKVLALKSRYEDALCHYREAIRLAVSIKAPELFFRHYTQCVMESLELIGAYSEVIEYCENVDQFFQKMPVKLPIHRKDHASNIERKAVNEFKIGQREAATEDFIKAIELSPKGTLPLSEDLLNWLKRGLQPDVRRVVELQKKYNYFVVRKELVDVSRARPITKERALPELSM